MMPKPETTAPLPLDADLIYRQMLDIYDRQIDLGLHPIAARAMAVGTAIDRLIEAIAAFRTDVQ